MSEINEMPVEVRFKKMHPDAVIPKRWSEDAVGYDIHASILGDGGRPLNTLIAPNFTRSISTGLLVEPPPGHFLMVCSRSGLAAKSIFVANAPGIIDPDYRGEIKVLIYNGSYQNTWIENGQRIAQLLILPITAARMLCVEQLSETGRGNDGFGSTGA